MPGRYEHIAEAVGTFLPCHFLDCRYTKVATA